MRDSEADWLLLPVQQILSIQNVNARALKKSLNASHMTAVNMKEECWRRNRSPLHPQTHKTDSTYPLHPPSCIKHTFDCTSYELYLISSLLHLPSSVLHCPEGDSTVQCGFSATLILCSHCAGRLCRALCFEGGQSRTQTCCNTCCWRSRSSSPVLPSPPLHSPVLFVESLPLPL